MELPRQEQSVDVTGEVPFHRQVASRETRRMAERHDRPIAEQNTREPIPEPLRRLEVESEDELREHAGETDAAEHATEAHILQPLPLESIVIDDAEQDEDEAALNDLANDFGAGAFRQATGQRIGRRDASHEQEQWEDEVVSLEAVPIDVLELSINRTQPAPLGQLEERDKDTVSTHNPEEIKAAQGIERKQAFRLRGRSLHGGKFFYTIPTRGLPGTDD